MATNLLIGESSAVFDATLEASTTAASGFNAEFSFVGDRAKGFKTNADVTTSQIDIDFGASVTIAPEFLIIARLDLIRGKDSADIEVRLQMDDNASFASPETEEDLTVAIADLVGANAQYFILETSFATAQRYARIEIVTTDSFKHQLPLISFGTWLDLGRDPSYPASIRRSVATTQHGARNPSWQFSFTWDGITDAKRNEFIDILRYKDLAPVWLYDQNDYILQGHTLVCAYIEDVQVTPEATNSNQIKITFREVI